VPAATGSNGASRSWPRTPERAFRFELKQNDKKRDPVDKTRVASAGTMGFMFIDTLEGIDMKRGIKRLVIGLASATFLFGGMAACSHHRAGGGEWTEAKAVQMRTRIVERISDKLDLDAAQKLKLDALADEIAAARKAVRGGDAAADPRAEMRALIAGERFDRAGAQRLFERKTAAVQAEGPKVMAALADFYDSLNADQQRKVRERLDKGHGRWGRFGT